MRRWVLVLALLWVGCGDDLPPTASSRPATPPVPEPAPEPEPDPVPTPPAAPIAIDTHVDTTQRMLDGPFDLAERSDVGHLDLPRMREGGLTGAFFSIWVDPEDYPAEEAWPRALALIGAVTELAERHPDQAVICRTSQEVRRAHAESKIALLIGVEGGHALGAPGGDEALIARLRQLYDLGARYMTITWSNDNSLGHASSGAHRRRGLTELGRRVIREMNRLGMIVDVSHVSDRTFWDIVEIAERPLLASHSSCRALADHPRNMTDAMIEAVHRGGGAVCVNYYTQFIDVDYAARRRALEQDPAHVEAFRAIRAAHEHSWDRWRPTNALARQLAPDLGFPTIETLGNHFQHVVDLAGPDAACLGSDFDGIGELPSGIEDVSHLGALREELDRRGIPVGPIFGGNVLRVLDAAGAPPILAPP